MKHQFTASQDTLLALFGAQYRRKQELEEQLKVKFHIRNDTLVLQSRSPAKLKQAQIFLEKTCLLLNREKARSLQEISSQESPEIPVCETASSGTLVTAGRRSNIRVRSSGQQELYQAVLNHDLVFAIGPAGTGKTYLSVAMAVEALRTRLVDRIVLARPAVEAGESLGFLPGNLKDKVDPYLAPLYDALFDILPKEKVTEYFENRTIEVLPLAYMRGRTLNNAFIILDEAQNATLAQLKMFLTRMGKGSRTVVAGDVTQVDLIRTPSGLARMKEILQGIPGIAFVTLVGCDVMRHRLVRDIIEAYANFEGKYGDKK